MWVVAQVPFAPLMEHMVVADYALRVVRLRGSAALSI